MLMKAGRTRVLVVEDEQDIADTSNMHSNAKRPSTSRLPEAAIPH